MKKATRDFAKWIAGISGMEKVTKSYESGQITLLEYIQTARKKELESIRRTKK